MLRYCVEGSAVVQLTFRGKEYIFDPARVDRPIFGTPFILPLEHLLLLKMRIFLLPTLGFIALASFVVADRISVSTSQVNGDECMPGLCNTERQTPGFTDM